MLTFKEQRDISELYKQIRASQINEMGLGPVALGEQPVGKPVDVAIELELPPDEEENNEDSVDRSDIDMACTALYMASELATELLPIVKKQENLPGWMSSKITLAFDYLSEVHSRIKYKDECCGCDSNEDTDIEVHTVGMFNAGVDKVIDIPV